MQRFHQPSDSCREQAITLKTMLTVLWHDRDGQTCGALVTRMPRNCGNYPPTATPDATGSFSFSQASNPPITLITL